MLHLCFGNNFIHQNFKTMNKQLIFNASKWLLALMMIVFGANKFLGFIEMPPPQGELAQKFMGVMFTTYLFKVVAVTQIIGGILLLIPKTAFIGFLVMLPIIVNIVGFHLFHDMPGNGMWLFVILITGTIAIGFKNQFSKLIVKPLN